MKSTFLFLLMVVSTMFHSSPAFSQAQERPFKGRIVGSFVNKPTSNPAIFSGGANASGTVTNLGVFTKVTSDVINVVSSTVEGTFVMKTAGGEELTGKYNGIFSLGTTAGTLSWTLNATITGGTGRFAHASGEFVFLARGTYTIENGAVIGEYTETFDGMITY